MQTLQGVAAVLLLRAVPAGLDDQYAVLADTAVIQVQQALLVPFRQGGGADIEPEVNRRGDLVDVLPAGAARADG